MNKIELGLSGMTCPSCVKVIEMGLSKVSGINSSMVNFPNKKIMIHFDDNLVNVPQIQEKIKELGYDSSLIITEQKSSCCGNCHL